MAHIGLRNFVYSILDEVSNCYNGLQRLAGAIESKASIKLAEAELYSDDVLAENVQEFTKGTITLTVDDDDDSIFAPLIRTLF